MKKSIVVNRKGFTLIELLVVVLIIGILASVALSQYQAAVDKAHLASYLEFGSGVQKAQNVYFMEHGEYAKSLNDLDLEFDVSGVCSSSYASNAWFAWNCKYGFGMDNHNSGTEKVFAIYFCPSEAGKQNGDYGTLCWNNQEAIITFYYGTHETYPDQVKCTSTTARGARLCGQFK